MFGKKDKNTADVKVKAANENKEPKFLTKISILIASLKFLWFVGHVIVSEYKTKIFIIYIFLCIF